MSFNLIDAAKGLFTSELVSKASSYLGESESGVSKAISGVVPAVLTGLVNKASSHEGAGTVAHMVEEQQQAGVLDGLGNFFSNEGGGLLNKGAGLLTSLFGSKTEGIGSLLSNFAGIKSSSASSLLSMALPAVLGLIGKHSSGGASGVVSLLSSQKENIAAAVPSGLQLGNVLSGWGGATADTAGSTAHHAAAVTEETGGGAMKFLLPLFLLAALAAGAWYLFGGGGKSGHDATVAGSDTVKTAPAADATATMPAAKESLKVKLANGTEIEAYKGGIEDKLVAFLNTDYKALGADSLKNIWFDFDNLNFKTASAELTPESQQQVDNMTAILKAYPALKLKIGGYTDKVGNEAANVKLSGARANAVKEALTKAGVGAQVTGAEGYGSQYAKYAADAPEQDRVKDRHVSVSVRL